MSHDETPIFLQAEPPKLSAEEKKRMTFLIVDPQEGFRSQLRYALKHYEYGPASDAAELTSALRMLLERRFTHIIFATESKDLSGVDFIAQALKSDPAMIAIAVSAKPNADELFELLLRGARGYMPKPFKPDDVNDAIISATKGERIPEEVLRSPKKHELLVQHMLNNLDRAAVLMKDISAHPSAHRELHYLIGSLGASVRQIIMLSRGGQAEYAEALQKVLIDRATGPATRLGRLRQRLAEHRKPDEK